MYKHKISRNIGSLAREDVTTENIALYVYKFIHKYGCRFDVSLFYINIDFKSKSVSKYQRPVCYIK